MNFNHITRWCSSYRE